MRAFSKCPNCGIVPVVHIGNEKCCTDIEVECNCCKIHSWYYEKAVTEWYHHILIENAKRLVVNNH